LDIEFSEERRPPIDCPLPFTGGWLVLLGYEIASEIEPRLKLPRSPDPTGALALRIPAALIYEHESGMMHLVTEPDHAGLLDDMQRDLGEVDHVPNCSIPECSVHEEAPGRFLAGVHRAKEYIAAGDVYQVNLSRGWTVQLARPADPLDLYRSLCQSNPAPFAASLVVGDWALLSSSPERLITVRNGEISTRPIAGTWPRSRIDGADAAETAWLAAHPKERAEHVMLVDLERNDLGRICVPGSVRVDELMVLESYEHVHHLVSNVRGRLLDGVTPAGVLRAVFPGGTITGCPKIRCMEIIAELEGVGRGAYTGSIGYLNRDGSGDFNILIRSMTYRRSTGEVRFRAGAGIVADSDPEQELEETRAKARGVLRAFEVSS
jgi:anthranilate synthase component 1